MHLSGSGVLRGERDGAHLVAREQAVDAIDVDKGAALAPVEQAGLVRQRLGFVETEDDFAMLTVRASEAFALPPLALVAAEIVNVERAVGLAPRRGACAGVR